LADRCVIDRFYICLYWFPEYFGGLPALFDPLSMALTHKPADQMVCVRLFVHLCGIGDGRQIHVQVPAQSLSTAAHRFCEFFQLGFAYLIPSFMKMMNQPEYYLRTSGL